jgi:hypothetical protein
LKKIIISTIILILIFSVGTSARKFNTIDDWRYCTISEAKNVINNGYDVNQTGEVNGTPLIEAVTFNTIEIVKLLVENGANINHKVDVGTTPLMLATSNNFEITDYLLKNGAKINVKNNDGLTPLHWAAQFAENEKTLKILLEKGADPTVKDKDGKTALDYLNENEDLRYSNAENLLKNYIDEPDTKNRNNYKFRNTEWGMSIKEVKNIEKQEPIYDNEGIIVYEDYIIDLPVEVIYIFVDNKLVRSKYIFIQKHTNENDFLSDYKSLNSALKNKYGKPIEENHFWSNDLYKSDSSNWGFAVSLGHHSYYTKWETSETTILSVLHGDNYEINMEIEYQSKELKYLEEKQKNKETESKL